MYKYDKYEYNVVLGFPRSGTTFLMECLEALPYSECVSECLLPYPLPHIANQPLSTEIYEALCFSFLSIMFNYAESGEVKSRYAAFSRWTKGCLSTSELIETYRGKRSLKRIVYKEPCLGFAPEYTYQSLPNCRIIYIYRDGRDAADSLVRTFDLLSDRQLMTLQSREMPLGRKYDHRYVPWWVKEGLEAEFLSSTPYVRSVWMWKEMVRRCHEFFSRPEVVASGRVLLLKYEDLVSDPLNYGKSVVEHLGCSLNERLRKQFKGARQSSVAIHKRRDAQEIEAAEKIAHSELELYGYLDSSRLAVPLK